MENVSQQFDIIVIGGGPAGYHFANLAAKKGFLVALFEEKSLGGTCLSEGCIPSKALLKSAKVVDGITNSEHYGISVGNFSVNQESVILRKNEIVSKLVMGVRGGLRKNKVKLFFTHADILKKQEGLYYVSSNEKIYSAEKLIIATGSKVFIPKIEGVEFGLQSGFVLTSTEILNLDIIPNRLVVIGGGIIGLEMASYFASVGSAVTVIEAAEKTCGLLDNEISSLLVKNLSKKGILFVLNAKVSSINDNGITYIKDDQTIDLQCDKVLLSVGRVANVTGFGLENLDVEFTNRGITVNECMQTNDSSVYAIGDVNGKVMLAHTAYREAEVSFNHIINNKDLLDYQTIPSVLYTSPECAWVGVSEEDVVKKSLDVTVKKLPMIYSGRFVAESSGVDGLCKIFIDNKKNTIIGAAILADGASELIVAISNLIIMQTPIDKINSLIFPHPTVGEIIKDVLNS